MGHQISHDCWTRRVGAAVRIMGREAAAAGGGPCSSILGRSSSKLRERKIVPGPRAQNSNAPRFLGPWGFVGRWPPDDVQMCRNAADGELTNCDGRRFVVMLVNCELRGQRRLPLCFE